MCITNSACASCQAIAGPFKKAFYSLREKQNSLQILCKSFINILRVKGLKPIFYKRYIDDILILWPHSELELNKLLSNMNSFHPSIKFTSEYSFNKITFLDVNIYKGPLFHISKRLDFQIFIKPTNRQAYVHASSYHPPGVSKGVAIGEMKRYLRTNSRVDSFNTFKVRHKANLRKRLLP